MRKYFCSYCARWFDDNDYVSAHFRKGDGIEKDGKRHWTTYYFCCDGHRDLYTGQTSLIEVNKFGRTPNEQRISDKIDREEKERKELEKYNTCCDQWWMVYKRNRFQTKI